MRKALQTVFLGGIGCMIFSFAIAGKLEIKKNISLAQQKRAIVWLKGKNPQAIVSEAPGVRTIISENRTQIDIHYLSGDKNRQVAITWDNTTGNSAAPFEDQWQEDVANPDYYVGSKSDKMVSVDIGNRLRVIDGDGEIINQFPLMNNYYYTSENIIYTLVNADASLILSGITLAPKNANKNYISTLILRTIDNKILLNQTWDDWLVRSIGMSNDSKFLGISLYKSGEPFEFKTIIMDATGNTLIESSQRTRRFLFDENNNYTAFFDKNKCELYDLIGRQLRGTFSVERSGAIIAAADFDNKGNLLIQSAVLEKNEESQHPWKYTENILYAINNHAEKLQSYTLQEAEAIEPALWFDPDSNQFFVGYSSGASYFQINN